MKVVSYGCDPEIFLQDAEGKIKSAIGLFGGTKEKPEPLKTLGDGYAVQEDNVLVEFNIPPATTPKQFTDSVHKTMALLSRRAAKHGLSFANGSAYSLDPGELEHPKAKVFGCEPDFNAYTGQKNPLPRANDPCLRSAGGHIAVGFDTFSNNNQVIEKNKKEIQMLIVRDMDMIWGIPSLLLDSGEKRKQLYGKGGAFRPKPFGVEYRTLSNFWIFNPDITQVMLRDFSYFISRHFLYSEELSTFSSQIKARKRLHDMVEIGINTNDKDFAKWFVRAYYPWMQQTFNYLQTKGLV